MENKIQKQPPFIKILMKGGILMEKFYTCKYDRAFKEVFGKEENKDILKKLLEEILQVEIEKIEYLNLERNVDNVKVKRKHLDLYLETNIGKIQVEVNTTNSKYVKPRNMSYLCDIYSHHTLVGQEYDQDTLIIQININYGQQDEKYIREYRLRDESGKEYIRNFIIYEINMEKYMKLWYNKNEKELEKSKYIVMLNLEKEELEKLSKKDKVVIKYMKELERVNENPKFREYMSAEEDNKKIENSLKREWMEEGLKEGIKEGSYKRNIEIAKTMLEKGMNNELISEVTGLSIEEIKKLNTNITE